MARQARVNLRGARRDAIEVFISLLFRGIHDRLLEHCIAAYLIQGDRHLQLERRKIISLGVFEAIGRIDQRVRASNLDVGAAERAATLKSSVYAERL